LKTKKLLSLLLALMVMLGLLPAFAITASAQSRTIYLYPCETWKSTGGRYTVYYEAPGGETVGWINMTQTSQPGFYSAVVPECQRFQFQVMQPGTSINNESTIMYRSADFFMADDGLNCVVLDDIPDYPGGHWTKVNISGSSSSTPSEDSNRLYLYPVGIWKDENFRIVARFRTESGTMEWINMTPSAKNGYYKVNAPENYQNLVFFLMPMDSENDVSMAQAQTSPYSTTTIKGNCLTLRDTASTTYSGTWSTVSITENDNGETGGEEQENANIMWGYSPEAMTNYGVLSDVLLSYTDIYIKLIADIEINTILHILSKNITLDLAGHKITQLSQNVPTVFRLNGSSALTMVDSSEDKTGRVEAIEAVSSGAMFSVDGDALLNIIAGTYFVQNYRIIDCNSQTATVEISGGTFQTGTFFCLFMMQAGQMRFYGGNFQCGIDHVTEGERNPAYYDLHYMGGEATVYSMGDGEDNISFRFPNTVTEPSINMESMYMISDSAGREVPGLNPNGVYYISEYHMLSYDLNGGRTEEVTQIKLAVGSEIALPVRTQITPPDMMEFSHWEYQGEEYADGSYLKITQSGSSTVKAIWKDQVQYKVTLHANDGTGRTVTTTEWSRYTLPDALPSGFSEFEKHSFAGWGYSADSASAISNTTVTLTKDTDFYVYWKCTYEENGICSCGKYEPATYDIGGYQIDNIGKLYWFANYAEAFRYSDAILCCDLDLEGREWIPIFKTDAYHEGSSEITDVGYKGTFDGNGKIIKNFEVKVDNGEGIGTYGLFGTLSGTVKKLGIENFTFNAGTADCRAGAIAGQVLEGGKIYDCFVQNSRVLTTSRIAGGIAGCNYGGSISRCIAYRCTITGHARSAHIVGDCADDDGGKPGSVTQCYADNAKVVGTQNGGSSYISDCEYKSAEQFASGEVTYLLNKGLAVFIWGQTVGEGIPAIGGPGVFYGYSTCAASQTAPIYANRILHTYKPEHGTMLVKYDDTQHWEMCSVCFDELNYKNHVTEEAYDDKHHWDACECGAELNKAEHYGETVSQGIFDCCGGYQEPVLQNSVYLISNAGQLYRFAEMVNEENETYGDINVKLTNNIVVNSDLSGEELRAWTPIGTEDAKYSGFFDGNGYTVSGLYMMGMQAVAGLFGSIDGTVTNVGVLDSCFEITGDGASIGSVVANNYGTLSKCYSDFELSTSRVVGTNNGTVEKSFHIGKNETTQNLTVTVGIPEDGSYTVVFADYEGGRLSAVEAKPVTFVNPTVTTTLSMGADDKMMLWSDTASLVPLCNPYIVK